jgi:hypothetical protein
VPNILIQNLTTEDVHLGDFYTKVPKPQDNGPCKPNDLGIVETFKTSVEIMRSVTLQKAIADGKVSLGITFTQFEIDSGFDIWPGLKAGAANIDILDEGVLLTSTPTSIDFVGDGVTGTVVGTDVTITILGSLAGDRVYNEDLTGTYDSVNATFTTAANFDPGSEIVVYNGQRLREGALFDYVRAESGGAGTGFDTIVVACPPLSGEWLAIDYNPS